MIKPPKPPVNELAKGPEDVALKLFTEAKMPQFSAYQLCNAVCDIVLHDIEKHVADGEFTYEQKIMYKFWIYVKAELSELNCSQNQ